MQPNESVIDPILLDMNTWIWHEGTTSGEEPSARYGHSVIHDEKRQRLLLFGGVGTSLSGDERDNAQVFELKMGTRSNFFATPWQWRLLHDEPMDVDNRAYSYDRAALSPAEQLNLGRCHVGHKVSPDTALFVFGSSKLSTNGLIAYNLANDAFFRPNIRGPGPIPRCSCASAFLERQGYLFVHGGHATQRGTSTSIDDMQVLDLAPALRRNDPTFAVNLQARDYPMVTDEQAVFQRREERRQRPGFTTVSPFKRLSMKVLYQ
jgi:hypothetical protein